MFVAAAPSCHFFPPRPLVAEPVAGFVSSGRVFGGGWRWAGGSDALISLRSPRSLVTVEIASSPLSACAPRPCSPAQTHDLTSPPARVSNHQHSYSASLAPKLPLAKSLAPGATHRLLRPRQNKGTMQDADNYQVLEELGSASQHFPARIARANSDSRRQLRRRLQGHREVDRRHCCYQACASTPVPRLVPNAA